ncbi:similar to RIKEN cDNA 6030446I19 gene (predicted) [Rattus norvegicus]|uniref:Similar to RIKEN cDNA 6030446I19 gene (Predicted) n=3 Tax=Rattus norvegicus TaxID=10116 RepID=A6JEU1_RAT|nr:similar to RIKEN cDNA 6030446I19 gene (predicted) [Rattus norvegicus]
MLHLYASMLYERRILIICSKLSTLTACIHGSAAMLYPMYWQHVYIPVLPPHLLDYCCAPMPYLIGIHLSLMEKVRNMALDDVVILNVDTNTLETPFDDLQSLPNDVISSLKNRLKKVSTTTGDGVARAFLKAQAAFFGSYRNALKIEPEEPITFSEEAFVSHYRSGAMRQFLQNATQLQLFKQFIDGRLDLLNSGEGFSDVFEEEISMGEYAGSDKLYHQWLSTVRKGSGAILNTVKTKANPAMKTVYKFAKDHAKMGIKEVKNRLKQKDITENGCASSAEDPLPKTIPSPLAEAKDPKLREDRRPITVHFGQVRPPRPHVIKRPKSNMAVEGRRTSISSPEQPQPYRTLKESDSAEGDETESPEQPTREPWGPTPAPPDRAASIDLLEDVFSSLDVEAPLQPLGQAKSLEDLRVPRDLREQSGSFDYQRLDLCRSERGLSMAAALKFAHPYTQLWSLGQDDMAIPSKPSMTSPEKPSALLGTLPALPVRPQNQEGILSPSIKEETPVPAPGSITIPRPQGRKTPELGIVPPPPTARPAKLQGAGGPLGDFSSEPLQMDLERQAALSPALLSGLLPRAGPQGSTELVQSPSPAPGAAGTGSDALLALLDPLNTAWSGSTIPSYPTTPSVATPFTPQLSFPSTVTPSPFAQTPLNPFVPSVPVVPPTMSLGSTPARPFGTPPASLGPAYAPSILLSGSSFCAPHRSQPTLSALSMPNLFGQIPMGAHTSPLQPLGPPAVAPSRIRTLPLPRSSARAAEAKQGLALRPGESPLLPPRPPQNLQPTLQPSAPTQARDPFEDLLRKTKQDVSPSPVPAPAPAPAPASASTSVEQLRRQWETFE